MSVWAWVRCFTLAGAILIALVTSDPASAQTRLRWAHVYEVAEPFHTEALWAASEIRKRSHGRFDIEVFPASQLGNENQLNEGLGAATIDIVYVGAAAKATESIEARILAVAFKKLGKTVIEPDREAFR